MSTTKRTPAGGYFLNAMDPGGDTGLGLLHIGPEEFELVDFATVAYDPHLGGQMPTATLVDWRLKYPGIHHLLYEDFHARNTSAQKDLTALKVIGSVDQMVFDRAPYERIFRQEPVEAKHMVSDEVLESLGLHLGHHHHQRHVRDTMRHAVTHLARLRYLPVCRAAYPRGTGTVRTRPPRPGSHP